MTHSVDGPAHGHTSENANGKLNGRNHQLCPSRKWGIWFRGERGGGYFHMWGIYIYVPPKQVPFFTIFILQVPRSTPLPPPPPLRDMIKFQRIYMWARSLDLYVRSCRVYSVYFIGNVPLIRKWTITGTKWTFQISFPRKELFKFKIKLHGFGFYQNRRQFPYHATPGLNWQTKYFKISIKKGIIK